MRGGCRRSWIGIKIVVRQKSGKLSVSLKKQKVIDSEVVFHLGQLKRDLDSGELIDECVYNADETHFKVENHDGRTLEIRGDE